MVRMRPRLRDIMPGRTREVTWRVPVMLVLMICWVSLSFADAKGMGISWDFPAQLMSIETSRP